MNRHALRRATLVATVLSLVLVSAGCASSGSLGTVPPLEPTPEPSLGSIDPDVTPAPSVPTATDEPSSGPGATPTPAPSGSYDRPGVLHPRRPARQRGSRSVPLHRPEDGGDRDRGDERAARGLRGPARRLPADLERDPARHEAAGADDRERRRDGRPVGRVRGRRRQRVVPVPPRPGRLHADPVPVGRHGPLQGRRLGRDGLRQRGDRPRRAGRPVAVLRPAADDLRRPAGVGRRAGQPRSRRRLRPGPVRGDVPDHAPRRRPARRSPISRRWPPASARAARSTSTVAYTVPKAQWGTLRVWDGSAKDGTPENVREYPVWLTPAR